MTTDTDPILEAQRRHLSAGHPFIIQYGTLDEFSVYLHVSYRIWLTVFPSQYNKN